MKAVLIYAGTSEGRRLAERLLKVGIRVEACVATEYGVQVLKGDEEIKIHQGRLSAEEMRSLYDEGDYFAVVDCTHPFATEVSKNIKESLKGTGIAYMRVARDWEHPLEDEESGDVGNLEYFADAKVCAEILSMRKSFKRILLTTGSKELSQFCKDPELQKRLVVRVLPGRESMETCWKLGLEGKQIIAMQGVSTKEMNLAVIRQYGIDCLVTKESGQAGGEGEKVQAAKEAGITCMMIRRPIYGADYMECSEDEAFQIIMEVREELDKMMREEAEEDSEDEVTMDIVLAGMGMGTASSMTVELQSLLDRTDYLFGAPRLIDRINAGKEKYPYYLAKDILPKLKELRERHAASGESCQVTVLFSGDSGFYSGCKRLREALEGLEGVKVSVLPGISSLAAFCAKIGEEWQDALILSAHGVPVEDWAAKLMHGIRSHKKVFMLTSGDEDVRRIGTLLEASDCEIENIWVGYQLSYPQEKIMSLTARECQTVFDGGLYVVMVIPKQAGSQGDILTPSMKDDVFIRDKVPMTKEEIRELSVCKLGLTEGAVIYDIGSGTGSVGVQIAALSGGVKVYAIEQDKDALALTRKNQWKFSLENLHVVEGTAPQALEKLPVSTHAFIGGSRGKLREILDCLYQKNNHMRVVINAVSLEGITQAQEILKDFPVTDLDIASVQVNKAKKVGDYHLMMANNPVTIFSFTFCEEESEPDTNVTDKS